ncbi:MAG TPA: ImmA/IrrE family metallo-endopeptidase [Planctomycetaceae bacterium]|nr:ImmA/IrrE family metallo-endopeptidase [Planctomycetaceae bacterium]
MPTRIAGNLRRLRAIRRMTQQKVADAAGISRIAYRDIENGKTADPRVTTLQKIADALQVGLQDLLAEAPRLTRVRFRAANRLSARQRAARDQLLVHIAFWLQDFNDLEDILGQRRPYAFAESLDRLRACRAGGDGAQQAAAMARELLQLGEEPIRDMPGLLESAGVKVRTLASDIKKFFGLSVAEHDGGPAVIVNVREDITVERRIFTAAHELGHLLLHPDAYDVDRVEENQDEEREADRFAGYFLMPDPAFEKEWDKAYGQPIVLRVLHVKRIFRVSYKTVLRRLVDRGDVGDHIWRWFAAEYRRQYGQSLGYKVEPLPLAESIEPSPLADPDFIEDRLHSLVRRAIDQGAISLSRGAEILGLSIEAMRERAASWEAAE